MQQPCQLTVILNLIIPVPTRRRLLKHGKAMKHISAKQDDTSALSGRSMKQIAGPHSRKWLSSKAKSSSLKNRIATLARRK